VKEKIEQKFPALTLNAYTDSVQNLLSQNPSFYNDYLCIIAGLDNVEARLFLNNIVFQLAKEEVYISLIDGGTEGHLGQVRVIYPLSKEQPCYECVMK
jgi:NEDD8-activating enzyme E1